MSDNEKYYRQEWMTDGQWACAEMLADIYRGWHHVPAKVKPFGRGIECNVSRGGFATFDCDDLTRSVFMAHDRCIRLAIGPSGPGLIKLMLWKRAGRVGKFHERHPSLSEAVSDWNNKKGTPNV